MLFPAKAGALQNLGLPEEADSEADGNWQILPFSDVSLGR